MGLTTMMTGRFAMRAILLRIDMTETLVWCTVIKRSAREFS